MKCKNCKNTFDKYNQQGGYVNNEWFCDFCINNQPERSKREDFKSYDDYNLNCGCHAEPGIFSRHMDCNLDHSSLLP